MRRLVSWSHRSYSSSLFLLINDSIPPFFPLVLLSRWILIVSLQLSSPRPGLFRTVLLQTVLELIWHSQLHAEPACISSYQKEFQQSEEEKREIKNRKRSTGHEALPRRDRPGSPLHHQRPDLLRLQPVITMYVPGPDEKIPILTNDHSMSSRPRVGQVRHL